MPIAVDKNSDLYKKYKTIFNNINKTQTKSSLLYIFLHMIYSNSIGIVLL